MPLPCFSVDYINNQKIDWFRVLCKNSPGECKAKISWDGTSSYFFNPQSDKTPSFFGDNDRIITNEEAIIEMVNKFSAGQKRLLRLHKLAEALKTIPDQTKVPKVIPTFEGPRNFVTVNSLYQNFATKWAEFMSSFKERTNVATILMDEPDRSLAIPETSLLWSSALTNLATKAQVIVATHSTFALRNEDAHWVTMGTDQDYVKKCREALKC
jgi:predicted ATP-dependent endonuclease of OLD family